MSMHAAVHIPVMLPEVIHALSPRSAEVYVDGTFGAGGYTRAILETTNCQVYAIDRDPAAIARGKAMQEEFKGRLHLLEGKFGDMKALLKAANVDGVHGLVLDIGVSSPQLDEAERGFSFQKDGPLDMRMSQQGLSALDVVNTYGEKELADIIYHLGEEHAARRIARSIVAQRPMQTTTDLAQAVYKVLPKHGGQKIDPATKTFQAIRIYVNNELEELERALTAAEEILLPEGRLVVVSFHGLEDKIVKNFLRERAGLKEAVSRYRPQVQADKKPTFLLQDKKSLQPSSSELQTNPRSRSARLRWAIRTMQDTKQRMEA